jgi:diguanylate cyclase (GGDEF)-like protein
MEPSKALRLLQQAQRQLTLELGNQLLASAHPNDAHRALTLLNTIFNSLSAGVTVQGSDGTCLLANATARRQFSFLCCDPNDALPANHSTGTDGARRRDAAIDIIRSGEDATVEEQVGASGSEHTMLTSHKPVRIQDRTLLLSTSLDITDRKRAELDLARRAYFDELTELPNRNLIQDDVDLLLNRKCGRFALAFVDIDNFKHINTYYTHAVGDALLKQFAHRIRRHIRPTDTLGRISGDEFILIVDPLETLDQLSDIIEELTDRLKEPFIIEGFEIFTSASVGVSVYPEHGDTYEVLRRNADSAMYRVKESTKGGAAIFDWVIGRSVGARIAQEQRLRLAVNDGLFCCAFQPKVDIRTQEVVGVEALARLRDEDGIVTPPGEFIGLATNLGLIDDLTYIMLAEVVKSLDVIDEAFGANTTVSINIAASQATDARFMRAFCDELESTGSSCRFIVEVTEEAFLVKNKFQNEILPMLRDLGVRVSIDDFGVGYSSLGALCDVTADEIKVDRSFITDIHRRPRSQTVLKAIEGLGEALGITVMVEGIECFEELSYLQGATRIRYGQGYYFAKPMFIDDLVPVCSPPSARSDKASGRSRAGGARAWSRY